MKIQNTKIITLLFFRRRPKDVFQVPSTLLFLHLCSGTWDGALLYCQWWDPYSGFRSNMQRIIFWSSCGHINCRRGFWGSSSLNQHLLWWLGRWEKWVFWNDLDHLSFPGAWVFSRSGCLCLHLSDSYQFQPDAEVFDIFTTK